MPNKRSPERVAPDDEEDSAAANAAVDENEEADAGEGEGTAADDKSGEGEGEGEAATADDQVADEEDEGAADERRARAMGWRPKNEWRGDPRKWRPASEYLDKAYANRPVFEERLDKMSGDFEEVKRRLTEATDVLGQMSKRELTAYERGYKARSSELQAAKDRAIEDGDKEAVKAVEAQQKELDDERAQVVPKADAGERRQETQRQAAPKPPEIVEFERANTWWNKDAELSEVAQAIERRLLEQNPDMPLGDRLKKVGREVRTRYPEKFENPRREAPGRVSPGRSGGSGKKGRTYADLPADAKAQCDKFVASIPEYTREKYVKTYEWE